MKFKGKKGAFLTGLAAVGTVTGAAVLAKIHRTTHYLWMAEDTDYAKATEEALEQFADSVRNEVRRRSIDGWLEPVIYQGQYQFIELKNPDGSPRVDEFGKPTHEIVAIRKFSDRLLECLAKAKCPEFREKHEITGKDGGPIRFDGQVSGPLRVEFVRPPKLDDDPTPGSV